MNRIALAASPKYSWTASTRILAPSLMLSRKPANRISREGDPLPGRKLPSAAKSRDVPEPAAVQSSDRATRPVAYPPMHPLIARERLSALLHAAAGRRIAVIGDAMLDVYLQGDVERISPEAPVPVVRVRARRTALGGAANVAQNVVALGAHCELACVVGADDSARSLRAMLVAIGAPDAAIVETSRPTTTKTRVLARAQQVVRVDEEEDGELAAKDVERVLVVVRMAVERADAVVLEDYNKGVLVSA